MSDRGEPKVQWVGGKGCPKRGEGSARERARPQERQTDGEGVCGSDRTCVCQ